MAKNKDDEILRAAQTVESFIPKQSEQVQTTDPNLRAEFERKQALIQGAQALQTPEGQQAKDVAIEGALGRDLTAAQKKQLKDTDAVSTIEKAEIKREKGVPTSPKENFMSALGFFLPAIIGGVAGYAFEGAAGAEAGIQGGFKGMQSVADLEKTMAETERIKGRDQIDPMELERLKMAQANLDARKEELKLAQRREGRIDEEQDERRFERSTDRVLRQKESFSKREDIKKQKEVLRQIKSLEDLAEVRVLPGTIGFKIAKGIAGEVGNLTEDEREASQISPSLWNRIKRYSEKTFSGTIPESDVKLIKEVGAKLKGKTVSSLLDQADKFSASRVKNLHPAHQSTFRDDLLLGIGVDPSNALDKKENISTADQKKSAWSAEKLERYKKWKAGRNKK